MNPFRDLWNRLTKADEGHHPPSLVPSETYDPPLPSITLQDLDDPFATPPVRHRYPAATEILNSPLVLRQFDEGTQVEHFSDLLTQAHTTAMSNAELVADYARHLASKYPEAETKALSPTQRMKGGVSSFELNQFLSTVSDAWQTPGNTFRQGTGHFMNQLSLFLDHMNLNKRPRSPGASSMISQADSPPPISTPTPKSKGKTTKRSPAKKRKLSPLKDSDHESLVLTDDGILPMK
jgi:hypothetical protein